MGVVLMDFLILAKGKRAEVGEIRTYKNGKKYQKVDSGKWKEVKTGKKEKQPEDSEKVKSKSIKNILKSAENSPNPLMSLYAKAHGTSEVKAEKIVHKMVDDFNKKHNINPRINSGAQSKSSKLRKDFYKKTMLDLATKIHEKENSNKSYSNENEIVGVSDDDYTPLKR